jgi:hypothetical protein
MNLENKEIAPDLRNNGPNSVPQDKYPGVSLTFTVDRIFPDPMFLVKCDRACFVIGGQVQGVSSPRPLTTNHPEIAGIALGTMGALIPNTTVTIVVRSADSQPIEVLGVEAYIPPIK